LAFALVELLQYWLHRLSHQRDFLWRFHAVHHSAERLYVLNAGRDHPLGAALFFLPELVPLILLGAPEGILALQAINTIVCGLFQHANIDIRLGPLRYVFSVGELHRWHHQRDVSEANHNFGANWILWDLVFATSAGARPSPRTGIGDMPNFPQTWWGQIKSLWTWKQLERSPSRQGQVPE
jgi:sterol desaturase/sphingolipid hydroxylase (fatty acid hydroxylase superfamily)